MGVGTNTTYVSNLTFIPALVFTSDLKERATSVHVMVEAAHIMEETAHSMAETAHMMVEVEPLTPQHNKKQRVQQEQGLHVVPRGPLSVICFHQHGSTSQSLHASPNNAIS